MTVLIAAAGEDGRTARARLAAAGFDVEHVTSLAAARSRAPTAAVVVAGGLEDATADDLRDALRDAGTTTPLVHLGADDVFDAAVQRPFDTERLARAVRVAQQAEQYRQAVDELYERCLDRAEAGDVEPTTDEAVEAAKRRVERAFRGFRRRDEKLPVARLFGTAGTRTSTDWSEERANGDVADDQTSP